MFINKCLTIFCNDMHGVKLRELDTGPDDDIIEGMPCHGDMVILKLSLQKSFYFQNMKPRRLEYRLKHIFFKARNKVQMYKRASTFFFVWSNRLLWSQVPPCIRLVRGKFELTNQDYAGGKKFTVFKSM